MLLASITVVSYVYLGIQLVPSLKWKIQTHITTAKMINQCKLLTNCPATIKQKISMVNTVIRAGIAYSFYAVSYSIPSIKKLKKKNYWIPKNNLWSTQMLNKHNNQLPHDFVWTRNLLTKNAYLRCISEQLRNAFNDPDTLDTIYKWLIQHIFVKYGGAENVHRLKYHDCTISPTIRTRFLMKKKRDSPQKYRNKLSAPCNWTWNRIEIPDHNRITTTKQWGIS